MAWSLSQPTDWLLLVVLISLRNSSTTAVTNLWNYELKDYSDHPCNRPCLDNAPPRLCQYDFLVENYFVLSKACYDCPFNQSHCLLPQCVSAGGVRRGIKTANRILPGPAVEVCEGDTIEVKMANMLDGGEGTSIHWHGIKQRHTPYMDGTAFVTQCPVLMNSYFTYRFKPEETGTYFWHGHSGTQRADGLFGALIIRQSPNREPHYSQYDYDLSDHVIFLTDWLTVMAADRLTELVHIRENLEMLILINGMGQFEEFKNESGNMTHFTPRATFTVTPGKRYRFRVISSGILNCPLKFSVDNHTLTIIASDGNPVQPLVRDSFTIHAGERFDFVITAKNSSTPRNYWIKVRGLNSCTGNNLTQTAILKYEGATTELPPEPPSWMEATSNSNVSGNVSDDTESETSIIPQMVSLTSADDIVLNKPDRKIYLDVDMVKIENLRSYNPPYYSVESSAVFDSPQINYITSMMPPSPPLTQLGDLPSDIFCNADEVQKNCRKEWCLCVHRYQINLGDLVELIILDDDAYHPMHLHGHSFRVVGSGKLEDGTPIEQLPVMDSRGELIRTNGSAPIKDTVAAPVGGYYILRFRADNPGVWLFHCHLEFHIETGMFLIFQVGNTTQLPRPPKNFPKCGSWEYTGDSDNDDNPATTPTPSATTAPPRDGRCFASATLPSITVQFTFFVLTVFYYVARFS